MTVLPKYGPGGVANPLFSDDLDVTTVECVLYVQYSHDNTGSTRSHPNLSLSVPACIRADRLPLRLSCGIYQVYYPWLSKRAAIRGFSDRA
nr:hypothetical protein CFP56_07907 [Quercus suber]